MNEVYSIKVRRRKGTTDTGRQITALPTGEMIDGTKVWTECNENNELINQDQQYLMTTKNGTMFHAM